MKQERTIDLDGEQYRTLKRIIEIYIPHKEVWAYGSRVKWKATVGADLDLVVFDCDFSALYEFRNALEESDLPISVDVMSWKKIPDDFKENIKQKYAVIQKKRSVPIKWQVVKLENAPLQIIDNDRGINYPKKTDFHEKGYCLFLNTKNVTTLGFSFSEKNFITKEKDQILRKGKLIKNDVVLTTRGTIGNVAFYDEKIKFKHVRINSGMVIIRPNGINPKFNFQLFKNLKNLFSIYTSGSAQPQLPIKDIKKIEILLPSISEQENIAEVLSSLDDKIDLLRHQNKTLESIAQTFYRKWIINNPNFINWKKISLSEILKISIGRTPPRKEFHWFSKNPKDIKWISVRDMGIDGAYIFNTSEYLTNDAIEEFNIPIIPSNTVVLSFKMTVGRVKITTENMLSNEAIAQFNFKSDTPFNEKYLYLYLKDFNFNAFGSTSSIAAAINCAIIRDMTIPVPEKQIIEKFEKTIRPIFEKIYANQTQIHILENLRDAILPKIMNGRTRIKEFVSQSKNEV